jgi:uncharacterized protein (TIGR03435 family)
LAEVAKDRLLTRAALYNYGDMFTAARNTIFAAIGVATVFALNTVTAPQLSAQASTPPSAFEVASVRLITPGKGGMISISPAGSPTFTATNIDLEILIGMAYGVDSDNILKGPSWLGSQQYDVTAKAEGNPQLTYEQLRAPLQKLLQERFQLAVHRQMKEGSGYALVAAKNGPKLQESKGDAPHAYILKGGLNLQNASLDDLAGTLKRPAGRPVVDETGIKGKFDIKLDYAPEGAANSDRPSLFTALQEQLGLQLVARKVPVEMLVIDRVERVPSEN